MRKFLPFLLVACSGIAWGQSGEVWFDAGVSALSNRNLGTTNAFSGSPSDYQLDNGFRFGFRADFNTQGFFGHEVQYQYSRTHFVSNIPPVSKQGMGIHTGGYNFLVYGTKEGTRIRPFGTGGVEFSNFVPPGQSAASGGGNTKYGLNYGAGVKVRLTDMFAVRFDLRQYATGKPFGSSFLQQHGWLRQNEISAGFGIYF